MWRLFMEWLPKNSMNDCSLVSVKTILALKESLASWRGQFGSHYNLEAWRVTPHCIMWCILREHNSRNFENCERMVVELKDKLFKTLYGWMATINSSHYSNFLEFMYLCSSSYVGCILHVYLSAPFCTFNKIDLPFFFKKNDSFA
jgi:hypothetical protein